MSLKCLWAVHVSLGRSEKSILTLRIMFRAKIYVNIYIEPRNEVKILKKRVLGISIFTRKLTRPPLGWKKNVLEYRVYSIQNDRLGHKVPTKQMVNWSEFRGPRYHPKRAEIWWFGLVRLIQARFGWYPGALNSDQFTICFVGTVRPSRSFWIQ